MTKCPKCGISIDKMFSKCPNCQTIISPKVKDTTMELPKLKNENEIILPKLNQEIEVLSLEETQPLVTKPKKEIKVKQIPLKVLSPVSHPNPKKEKEVKEKQGRFQFNEIINSINLGSTIKIAFVSILLVTNITLITNIVNEIDNTTPAYAVKFDETAMKVIKEPTSLSGLWITQNNGLFKFQEDNHFYWYDSSLVLDDNYYGGTFTKKQGLEAIEEMGYDETTFRLEVEDVIDINNVYSLELTPLFSFKNKTDNSLNDIRENEKWWFLIIINDDGTAFAYNQTLDLRYNMKKS